MRLYDLLEGIKVSTLEKSKAISRSDFKIGMEYEFRGFKGENGSYVFMNTTDIGDILDQYNIPYGRVEKEHDHQVEVITDIMSVPSGMKHLQRMFELLKTKTDVMFFDIDEHKSGLHISISLSESKYPFNPLKFLLFMNTKYINTLFPERNYTVNNDSILSSMPTIENIDDYDVRNNSRELDRFSEDLQRDISGGNSGNVDKRLLKFTSIKLSDYVEYNGRVELRFFGGKDYLNYELVKDQIARSLYLLDIAHGDKFDAEYKKLLYKLYQEHSSTEVSLLDKLKSGKPDATTLKELFNEWTDINENINDLENSTSTLHYLKLLNYVKEYIPKRYEKYKHNIKHVIKTLSNVNGDLRILITWVPELVDQYVDTIIEYGLHERFDIRKIPDNTTSLPISVETWEKLLDINIGNLTLSNYDDPLNISLSERISLGRIVDLNSKIKLPPVDNFLKEYAKLLRDNTTTYEKFSSLMRVHERILKIYYPGFMEELMLDDLDI